MSEENEPKPKAKRVMSEGQKHALTKMREALEIKRKARIEAKAKLIDDDRAERLEKVERAKKVKESLDVPDGVKIDVKPKQKRGRKIGERIPYKKIPTIEESDEEKNEDEPDEFKQPEPVVFHPQLPPPTTNPYIFLMRQKKRR